VAAEQEEEPYFSAEEEAALEEEHEPAEEFAPELIDEDYRYAATETPAPLVSSDAAASIAAQFQSLAASMVINDSGLLHDYAREMLRPMLKAWLDDNLPVLVERLVRAEIERVARGGRK
jgi:cell pole-organizing protein PopZ